jgi:hypothetical protein
MRNVLAMLAAALMVAGAIGVNAQDKKDSVTPKPEVSTFKGEVVDLHCFLDNGGRGEKHKQCAIDCAKAGNPIGLVDEKGEAYLLMGSDMAKPMRDDLIKNMAATVTVKGKLVKTGGLQAIYMESIEAAK